MHQEFVARIEEAEELVARWVGWLKVADNLPQAPGSSGTAGRTG
jgi:hypothetical protein